MSIKGFSDIAAATGSSGNELSPGFSCSNVSLISLSPPPCAACSNLKMCTLLPVLPASNTTA